MPDKRLIDMNALLETHRCRLAQNAIKVENGTMTKPYSNFEAAIMECLAEYLSSAPTIDAVEVVHGRWVFDRPNHYKCSVCDAMWSGVVRFMKFCPDCGAKMDGGAEG